MIVEDALVISRENLSIVEEKLPLVLQYWLTDFIFEAIEDEETQGAMAPAVSSDQWLKLTAPNQADMDKAKEFLKALTNPQIFDEVEVNDLLRNKLNENFLNILTEKHQVYFMDLGTILLCQGSIENVQKALVDLRCEPEENLEAVTNNLSRSTINSRCTEPTANESVSDENENETAKWTVKSKNKKKKKKKIHFIQNKNERSDSRIECIDKRPIIIDGSNVAIAHGNGKHFSCIGIKKAVTEFQKRGHKNIQVIVPEFRQNSTDKNRKHPTLNPEILGQLKEDGFLCYTPSGCYDDGFILQSAERNDAIIVSNDKYRDLRTSQSLNKLVQKNLLRFSFVFGEFELPRDPRGKKGPSLDVFLSKNNSDNIAKTSKDSQTIEDKRVVGAYLVQLIHSNEQNSSTTQETNRATSIEPDQSEEEIQDETEPKLREPEETNEIFEKLNEIFPESGCFIIELLNKYPYRRSIHFFEQNFDFI